jgi:iron uptake system EfeUOB component EfeO/EfeM
MAEQNTQSLDAAVEETIELAHQVIEQTRAEIARSQALSQAESDLTQSIDRMADDHDNGAHEQQGRTD